MNSVRTLLFFIVLLLYLFFCSSFYSLVLAEIKERKSTEENGKENLKAEPGNNVSLRRLSINLEKCAIKTSDRFVVTLGMNFSNYFFETYVSKPFINMIRILKRYFFTMKGFSDRKALDFANSQMNNIVLLLKRSMNQDGTINNNKVEKLNDLGLKKLKDLWVDTVIAESQNSIVEDDDDEILKRSLVVFSTELFKLEKSDSELVDHFRAFVNHKDLPYLNWIWNDLSNQKRKAILSEHPHLVNSVWYRQKVGQMDKEEEEEDISQRKMADEVLMDDLDQLENEDNQDIISKTANRWLDILLEKVNVKIENSAESESDIITNNDNNFYIIVSKETEMVLRHTISESLKYVVKKFNLSLDKDKFKILNQTLKEFFDELKKNEDFLNDVVLDRFQEFFANKKKIQSMYCMDELYVYSISDENYTESDNEILSKVEGNVLDNGNVLFWDSFNDFMKNHKFIKYDISNSVLNLLERIWKKCFLETIKSNTFTSNDTLNLQKNAFILFYKNIKNVYQPMELKDSLPLKALNNYMHSEEALKSIGKLDLTNFENTNQNSRHIHNNLITKNYNEKYKDYGDEFYTYPGDGSDNDYDDEDDDYYYNDNGESDDDDSDDYDESSEGMDEYNPFDEIFYFTDPIKQYDNNSDEQKNDFGDNHDDSSNDNSYDDYSNEDNTDKNTLLEEDDNNIENFLPDNIGKNSSNKFNPTHFENGSTKVEDDQDKENTSENHEKKD